MAGPVGGVSLWPRGPSVTMADMQIALALYPGFTALDIVGPFQTLVDVPGLDVAFVADTVGPVTDHTGRFSLVATARFAETTAPEVIVVPGGMVEPAGPRDPVVRWIETVHPLTTWTTSVCTGSLFLAAAGVLDGVDATGHWAAMDRLGALGACPTPERVVERGKVITAAGVSAGIDMGLTLVARLAGDDMARAIQLAIEYDPQPPFDAGAPEKVEPELRALVLATLGGRVLGAPGIRRRDRYVSSDTTVAAPRQQRRDVGIVELRPPVGDHGIELIAERGQLILLGLGEPSAIRLGLVHDLGELDGVVVGRERCGPDEGRRRAHDEVFGEPGRDARLDGELAPVDDRGLVVDGVVAGPGRVAEEHVRYPDGREVHVVAPTLAEDRRDEVGLERRADGRVHRVLESGAAGLRADGEARVPEAG